MSKDIAGAITVYKSKIRIKDLTVEDKVLGEYLYQYKDDPEKAIHKFKQLIRVGAHALTDDRLMTLVHRIENDLAVDLQSLKEKLLLMEEEGATTRGQKFEDVMAEEIASIAANFEDTSVPTGTETGEVLNSKVGDVVVTLNPENTFGEEKKIVFEIKTETYTIKTAFDELEEARQNRVADEAVIVFNQGSEPKEAGVFRRYPQHGIICSVDDETMNLLPLELAYRYARASVIATLREKEGVEVDGTRLADLISQAQRNLKTISTIKRSITKSKKSSTKAYEALDELQEGMESVFEEMEEALTG